MLFPPLPHAALFWLLLALGAIGFGLLYATVRDAGRSARRRAVARRLDALGAPGPSPAGMDEAAVDALRDAMAQARQVLAQRPGTGTAVPWFMFLGDNAADLPGLLGAARAERLAPVAGGEAFGGDYWHWWLGTALAAIEIHPSAVADLTALPHTRTLWLQTLMALAERRERLPLHGVVVCVGAHTLLRGDPEDTRRLAARLRRLVDETGDALRLQMPCYLVVTGLERIAGYAALRGALAPEVLAQALGHRFDAPFGPTGGAPASGAARMDAVFGPFAQQLHALRMALLRTEGTASSRLAVHEFVEGLRALQPALRLLADVLFEHQGRSARGPRWRGLYFTAAASGASGGAFVHDLFERFLPADQPLVRPGRASSGAAG